MNNRSNGSVSFNTIKRSHRAERLQRRRQGRVILLAICAVLLLLALTGLIFLVVHIAHIAQEGKQPLPDGSQQGDGQGSSIVLYGQPIAKTYADSQTGDLILVNKTHEYRFPDVRVENLDAATKALYNLNSYQQQTPTAYNVSSATALLQPHAAQALHLMLLDYNAYTGDGSIWAFVAYRTYQEQANKSFPQGFSDHHTALLVSLTVDKDGKTSIKEANTNHKWIFENCHKYGFVQRFPADKSGLTGDTLNYTEAFRYVGVAHATYMKSNRLCLEEYVTLLKNNHTSQNGTDGKHLSVDVDADGTADYEIYYVPANTAANALTTIPVPSNLEYSVSGDNCGGFIVTVNLDRPIA